MKRVKDIFNKYLKYANYVYMDMQIMYIWNI